MRTVLITGASRGIGAEIAKKYIIEGFKVAMNCKNNIEMLENIKKEYNHINKNLLCFRADVGNYSEMENMFKRIGGIDILINNAGVSEIELFNETNPENWKNIIDINFTSVLNTTHLALPYMLKKSVGYIINISSIWGNTGASCEALYSATKGAVNAFTKSLGKELAISGINVNAIACGVIDTEMNNTLTAEEKEMLVEQIPINRMGTAKEVAELCFFLTSGRTNFLTGQVITMDGAFS